MDARADAEHRRQVRRNPVIKFAVERDINDDFGNGRFHSGKILLGITTAGTSIMPV